MAAVVGTWEELFQNWARPPSQSEEVRSENTLQAIRGAIQGSSELNHRQIMTFAQGSFRNRVNVAHDSDVDAGVMLHESFLPSYPAGMTGREFNHVSSDYGFSIFKNDVERALVRFFGRDSVRRGNKAFKVTRNSHQVEADVVPLLEFREYFSNGEYRAGVALLTDQGQRIENYPERLLGEWPQTPLHYENGLAKNTETLRRYRGLVRILKKLRNYMADSASSNTNLIPGYLVECLCWNSPNSNYFYPTWESRVRQVLSHIANSTQCDQSCSSWREVDDIKVLFGQGQPWTRNAAHTFAIDLARMIGIVPP